MTAGNLPFALAPRPLGTKALRRLGEAIRDGNLNEDHIDSYDEVMAWYNDLAEGVHEILEDHDWSEILPSCTPKVTSRSKTIDTLREKLQRDHNTPFGNIQDVAGVRVEAPMTLDDQVKVAAEVARIFDHADDCIRDLRTTPHSGYRAVHVWLRDPGRVEIQVRTRLQGAWANMYERAADYIGRYIRYGELPSDPETRKAIEELQDISLTHIKDLEEILTLLAELQSDHQRALSYAEQVFVSPARVPPHVALQLRNQDDKVKEFESKIEKAQNGMLRNVESLQNLFESFKKEH
ncbi:hypothetical protein [Arthrobacter crystallopoietes]|uniref:PpGpp synthetase catalytic domain-containing protein (RelA/SpoT-type nucleotidyltranferase) n=1 Tax=Crystallibacter crystallopoietes TaxID=37928 RepID=A0A1H1FUT4_9MICC|nr:hypothetical protein [Arthrobacter crystallopoietes]AUI52906.1 hypothetical protein AC20117_21055 [Arthrobacter crystallopoietes]SDR04641.1 ppGpp synthetase catalytic domain-containing protein (RelA/SpoT-type nucleotidyltranferase) [Arthrobacter crystallopoietes]